MVGFAKGLGNVEPGDADGNVAIELVGVKSIFSLDASAIAYEGSKRDKSLDCQAILKAGMTL